MTAVADARAAQALPGSQFPLGATPADGGTNFAVASGVADAVTLCLFDDAGTETQIPLPDYDAGVWHGFVPGVGPGQAYGYRVTGPYDPARGLRCNPAKLLLDPYARAISGEVTFGPEVLGYAADGPDAASTLDSAGHMPRSLVVDGTFAWTDGGPRGRRYSDTVIYEVHVKGFTMRHPGVPAELRGTYAGFGHEAAVGYLADLGVTAVELLPVHQNVPESFLPQRGLTNYWGYNTIGYFAPHNGYSAAARAGRAGGQVAEFKAMVDALHAAGIEVILDVVFNHSAEADQMGPTLCFRGLDNPAYYRLDPRDPSRYIDTTGCGNSLNAGDTLTLQLIMDSLRYWVTEMHVDGFRFDLAPSLARQEGGFDQMSAFFDLVAQDPVVSPVKLVAEPWDVGQMDSYDVGRFPPLWREWNGKYRDAMRDFWRSHQIGIGEFATRFAGSADLYGGGGAGRRRPTASVNLFTVHDGFTLRDLVSYNDKHNEANGENNRDGTDDNRSWNCGVEGPATDPVIVALRARQSRAMLTTELLSFGVPMLLGGDERGRTQQGNNNAYCQDNEITWFDWSTGDDDLLAGKEASELGWFTFAGTPMTPADWADPGALSLAIYLDGSDDPDRAEDGTPLLDDDFLVLFNAWWKPLDFVIPETRAGLEWRAEVDSYDPAAPAAAPPRHAGDRITVGPRSVAVLRGPRP
jgi:isoamylase